ncbi:MAG: hypothetical protein LBT91_00335, partial [Bifidobacteriaceae bacterium]|nr:hypothetical protein [Bifidobacteriaceae bacterium]
KTAKIIIERREELKNEKSKNYVRLLLDKNKVIPQKKLDANEKVGSYIYGKDIKSMIYNAMRPNMEESEDDSKLGNGMQIVKRKLGDEAWQRVKQSFGKSKSRGNMAIFVCPYIDCQHIADADLQAAFNIAVRGYLKMQAHTRFKQKKDKNKRGKIPNGYLTKERLCYEQSKLVFDPVGF